MDADKGIMKAKILFLVGLLSAVAILGGCFAHWEGPSSKVAKQADNFLENERDTFFHRYCYLYGVALNCLNKGDLDACKEDMGKAQAYQKANYVNAKRFISPSSLDHIKLASSQKKMEKLKKELTKRSKKNDAKYMDFMKEGMKSTIDTFTEKEWDKCREVAEVK